MEGKADQIVPARKPFEMEESPALSLIKKALPTLRGRKVGVMVTNGADDHLLEVLRKALAKEGATLAIIAPKVGGVKTTAGKSLPADHALSAAPSIFFDAVAIVSSADGVAALVQEAAAVDWVRDAFGHLKVIGYDESATPLLEQAAITPGVDGGVVAFSARAGIAEFIAAAKLQRIWEREPTLRSPGWCLAMQARWPPLAAQPG
jgi:catalase